MKKGKLNYLHVEHWWSGEYVLYRARIVFIIICILFVLSVLFCSISWSQYSRKSDQMGNGYLKLAEGSSSIEMSIGYLEMYKNAIEDNQMTTGSAGLFYKTPNNDMAYRYQRLVNGIEFLKMFTNKTELDQRINTLDINMYSMMVDSDSDKPALRNYISSLDVGISSYLSANYLWWRFCDVGSFVTLILSVCLGITVIAMGVIVHI